MIPKPLKDFIFRLHRATDDGDVRWHAADGGAYFCTHKGLTLHISSYFDPDREESSISFRIDDTEDASSASFDVVRPGNDFTEMNHLLDSVSVNASRIEEKLKSFFD